MVPSRRKNASKHNTDPNIQVHWYDEHTVILRQNMAINYEAPFMFLLFGGARAVLLAGATSPRCLPAPGSAQPLAPRPHRRRRTIRRPPSNYGRGRETRRRCRVPGTHGRPGPTSRPGLGGRALDCIASPGHDAAALTFYDAYTGLLLTGDTVYPGRLYVEDWTAFGATIDRLIAFTETHLVTHARLPHRVSNTPGVDHPIRPCTNPTSLHWR